MTVKYDGQCKLCLGNLNFLYLQKIYLFLGQTYAIHFKPFCHLLIVR